MNPLTGPSSTIALSPRPAAEPPTDSVSESALAAHFANALRGSIWSRIHRAPTDLWDIVRWTHRPFEIARATLPLPQRWMDVRVLNDAVLPLATASAGSLSVALAALKNVLKSETLVNGRVDYRSVPISPAYALLREQSGMLKNVLPENFHYDAERIAFWLNLYNVLTIHGAVELKIRRSVMEFPSFFSRVAYRVGVHAFSLDDISNGILRADAPRPGTWRQQFRTSDERKAYCCSVVDPRIHGALVCAATSCPPVSWYCADQLEEQLNLAAQNLMTQCIKADEVRRELHLPLHFYYYVRDFGGPTGVFTFLLRYMPQSQHPNLLRAVRERWKICWDRYDWALNSHV